MKTRVKLITALLLLAVLMTGCAPAQQALSGLEKTGTMELNYAEQFSVDYYEGGYKLLSLADGSRYLVIPEGGSLPEGLPGDIRVLYQPIQNIYLAATASMCLFDALDALDVIRLSGTQADGWFIENAAQAMRQGKILFAGKYSAPAYELLLAEGCPLAIESTMIGHASDVAEKLEELGITVLTDLSSLEKHPLGRTEWIRLYGALLNKEQQADALFDSQAELLREVESEAPTGQTVAFFYVSSSGRVVTRKSGDYVSRMIELAGGEYVFRDLGNPENAASTVTIEMETFFASAKDADCIIYNSTIGGEIGSIQDLLEKSSLFAQFRAVQNGNVWCTGQNMYQQTTQLGEMIQSFHKVFSGEADGLDEVAYLRRLK